MDGSLISSYSYTLDASGNRTKVEEEPSGRVVDYVYDSTNRLLSETITEPGTDTRTISYEYDKVGNRLTKTEDGVTTTYTYDANNRLIQEDDIIYHYDDNGNLTEKIGVDEQVHYAYDAENHLILAETTRFGVTIVVEYEYDAHGNRVKKSIDGLAVTAYLVDENRDYAQILEERDGDGNLLVRYVYGHDLISQTRDGVTSFYHYDGLGSTRALTSSAGIVTDTYTYDAFGILTAKTGSTPNDYLFTGEQFDQELGLYYLRARYMDPNVGRFVTMDTFAGQNSDPVTLHKYLYANANPVNYVDPSGYQGFMNSLGSSNVMGNLMKISTNVARRLSKNVLLRGITRSMLSGAAYGAIYRGIDAALGGENVGKAMIDGALGGAKFGFLVALPYLRPVIIAMGLKSSLEGVYESWKAGKNAQMAFRAFLLYRQIKVLTEKGPWRSEACFTGETLIYAKAGYTEIRKIRAGDEIYSTNIETGERGLKKVTRVFIKEVTTLLHVFIDDREIHTTLEHPFRVQEKGWIPAGKLQKGDRIELYNGEYGTVKSTRKEDLTEAVSVYNFEVEDWHTYFVSDLQALVHNQCDGDDTGNALFHYTDEDGALSIESSGVIQPDNRGRVFVTTDEIKPENASNALFMGRGGSKGSHLVMIELLDPNDPNLTTEGTAQPNELIYQGAVRNGRNASFVVMPNPF